MGPVALVIGAVVGVVGTVMSIKQQRKAAKLQERMQRLAARRERLKAIRSAQIQRAQAVASAQGAGIIDGSGAEGGIRSISSRLGEGLGFSTQGSNISGAINAANRSAMMWGGIAELGSGLFNLGSSYGGQGQSGGGQVGVPNFYNRPLSPNMSASTVRGALG